MHQNAVKVLATILLLVWLQAAYSNSNQRSSLCALFNNIAPSQVLPSWDCNAVHPAECNFTGVKCNGSNVVTEISLPNALQITIYNSVSINPSALNDLAALTKLDLSSNRLMGSLPTIQLPQLVTINLFNNSLTGSLPSLQGATLLNRYEMSSNLFSGSIPTTVSVYSSLKSFGVFNNLLIGSIPNQLWAINSLTRLSLYVNTLTGTIPSSAWLGKTDLERLLVSNNSLSGTIPTQIGDCTSLVSLVLHGNQFIGSVPDTFCNLTNLERFTICSNDGRCGNVTHVPSCIVKAPNSTLSRLNDKVIGAFGNTTSNPTSATPSHQPSDAPSTHPSINPTAVPSTLSSALSSYLLFSPSSELSSCPSAAPSELLSAQPSDQPSYRPSSEPSGCPSTAPSQFVSALPSHQPSYRPSSKPSGCPSAAPSELLSAQPSDQPSYRPSSEPSGCPSTAPSQFVSALPSHQPSYRPSSEPSRCPSAAPSELLSAQPSDQLSYRPSEPSGCPSTAPSQFVSALPSHQPSYRPPSKPSGCPSAAPSELLSAQPSDQLSYRPSSEPSGCPSTAPSQFVSALPSHQPSYRPPSKPSGCPSAAPSELLSALPSDQLSYRQSSKPSGCPTAAPSQFVSVLLSEQPSFSPSSEPSTVTSETVPSSSESVPSSSESAEEPSFEPSILSSLSPSSLPSNNIATFRPSILSVPFPLFYPVAPTGNLLDITVGKNVIQIRLNVSSPGIVYCGAFPDPISPSSVFFIKEQGFSNSSLTGNHVFVNISGLYSNYSYKIFCSSADFNGHFMDLSRSLETGVTIVTDCCSELVWRSYPLQIFESLNTDRYEESLFSFLLDRPPDEQAMFEILLHPSSTCGSLNLSGAVYASPARFAFSSNSSSLLGQFIVLGVPGCYSLNINQISGLTQYTSKVLNITIISIDTEPPPPFIHAAQLSLDGLSIKILFDSITDRALSVIGAEFRFRCSLLFSFVDSTIADCNWVDNSEVHVQLPYDSEVMPGDFIYLLGGTIKANCRQPSKCPLYNYAPESFQKVMAHPFPMQPAVVISTPSEISGCDDIILDPSSSSGNGGRPFTSVVWSVSSGSGRYEAEISALLNFKFNTTLGFILVPNSYLSIGHQYYITLALRNYMGGSSKKTVKVTLLPDVGAFPKTLIFGPNPVNYLRSQSISLHASVNFTSCGSQSFNGSSFRFIWKLYQDSVFLPLIKSASLNPMVFRIPPYALDSASTYVAELTSEVKYIGASAPVFAYASVLINTGISGVAAQIAGGSERSVGSLDILNLDASGSKDLDDPSCASCLRFEWTCLQLYPSFGESCALDLDKKAILNLNVSSFYTLHNLKFTVFVTNLVGFKASTDVVINLTPQSFPFIKINSRSSIFNANDKVVLNAEYSGSDIMTLSWSSTNFSDISDYALTPSSRTVSKGKGIYSFSLMAEKLQPGAHYLFSASAAYSGESSGSVASLLILINRPPSGGRVESFPTIGHALSTVFRLVTSVWLSSSLPLRYTYQYRSTSNDNFTLQSISDAHFVDTLLGQGNVANNFTVSVICIASDFYDASTPVTTSVIVQPPINLTSALEVSRESILIGIELCDSNIVYQAVTATVSLVNTVNCTLSSSYCALQNREGCAFTANTCGSCLKGYFGVEGDSNSACVESNFLLNRGGKLRSQQSVLSIGASCNSDSLCFLGICYKGFCAPMPKTCQNNCSANGECIYSNSNGIVVELCDLSNMYCTARCKCNPGFYGIDCSLSLSSYIRNVQIKEELCGGLLEASNFQDIDTDVFRNQARQVLALFRDPTVMSAAAIGNCTKLLISAIEKAPDISGILIIDMISALSALLLENSSIELKWLVSNSLAKVISGHQKNLIAGEKGATIITPNIRTLSIALTPDADAKPVVLHLPISDLESFLNSSSSSLTLTSGINSDTAISLQQTSSNFDESLSSLALKVTLVSNSSFTKMLENTPFPFDAEILVKNIAPADYGTRIGVSGTINCTKSTTPYNVTVICPAYPSYNLTCPATSRRIISYQYTCPSNKLAPVPVIWNGAQYTNYSHCAVIFADVTSTKLRCKKSTERILLDSGDQAFTAEIGTTTAIVARSIERNILSIQNVSLDTLKDNVTISSTMAIILGLTLVGLLWFVVADVLLAKKKSAVVDLVDDSTVEKFFDRLLPDIFKRKPWYLRFWNKLKSDHDWLCIAMPYSKEKDPRSTRWILAMGKLINTFFVNTLLASIYFNDDGTCETYTTSMQCLSPFHIDQQDTLCRWDRTLQECSFNNVDPAFVGLLILATIIAVVTVPFNMLLHFLIVRVKDTAVVMLLKLQLGILNPAFDNRAGSHLSSWETWKSRLLLAARITKMISRFDSVNVDDEATNLRADAERSIWLPVDQVNTKTISGQLYQRYHLAELFAAPDGNPLSAAETVKSGSFALLIHRLKVARKLQQRITVNIRRISNQSNAEKYLLQRFIVESLRGIKRSIVYLYFFSDFDRQNAAGAFTISIVCLIFLPIYFICVSVYIFLFGLSIGDKATQLWLLGGFIAFLQDVLIFQPLKIWVKYILVTASASEIVCSLHTLLQHRGPNIMKRHKGLMTYSNALVQHFNPACRAARSFPELPAARLLMSLNDFDLPNLYRGEEAWDNVSQAFTGFVLLLLFLFTLAPEPIQDGSIEVGVTVVINLVLYGFSSLSYYHFVLPYCVAVLILLLLYLRETIERNKRNKRNDLERKRRRLSVFLNNRMEHRFDEAVNPAPHQNDTNELDNINQMKVLKKCDSAIHYFKESKSLLLKN